MYPLDCNKKIIHSNSMKPAISMQITLDDDKNVPDSKADVEKIITSRGEIEITEAEPLNNKIKVQGFCRFYVLYSTDIANEPLCSLESTIPFEQILNCDEIVPKSQIKLKTNLEDLSISIINSRKLSARCLIHIKVFVNETDQLEAATELDEPQGTAKNWGTPPAMECLYQTVDMTTLFINKKDVFRIKERLPLPQGKPPIHEILWSTSNLKNCETKTGNGVIHLSGDLSIFLLYVTDDETMSLQHFEIDVPFSGEIPCEECTDQMIGCVDMSIGTTQYSIPTSLDTQDAELDLEASIDLDIRIYQDENISILQDCYSPNAECHLQKNSFSYVKLLQKNNAKARITNRLKLKDAKESILQICHIDGTVKIDDMTIVKDGIDIEGVIATDLLYLTSSDMNPIGASYLLIPFHYLVEIEGISQLDNFDVNTALEQLSINMVDENEVEIKAILSLSAIAFRKHDCEVIESISLSELDSEKMQTQPGMIGYIVKSKDTLWNIAKTYYTTADRIRSCNELESDALHTGQKLIIVK